MRRLSMRAAFCLGIAILLAGAISGAAPVPPQDKPRADLLELLGNSLATHAQVGDVATVLMEKRQLIIVALAGQKARLRATQQAISDFDEMAKKAAAADEGVLALQANIQVYQKLTEVAEKGGATTGEMTARRLELTRQTLMLEDRIEFVRTRIKDGALPHLEHLEVEAAGEVQALEAELVAVEAQLEKIGKVQAAG